MVVASAFSGTRSGETMTDSSAIALRRIGPGTLLHLVQASLVSFHYVFLNICLVRVLTACITDFAIENSSGKLRLSFRWMGTPGGRAKTTQKGTKQGLWGSMPDSKSGGLPPLPQNGLSRATISFFVNVGAVMLLFSLSLKIHASGAPNYLSARKQRR